jgi:hypothetical protein
MKRALARIGHDLLAFAIFFFELAQATQLW